VLSEYTSNPGRNQPVRELDNDAGLKIGERVTVSTPADGPRAARTWRGVVTTFHASEDGEVRPWVTGVEKGIYGGLQALGHVSKGWAGDVSRETVSADSQQAGIPQTGEARWNALTVEQRVALLSNKTAAKGKTAERIATKAWADLEAGWHRTIERVLGEQPAATEAEPQKAASREVQLLNKELMNLRALRACLKG
jgi:hypothetical protein